MLRQKIFALRLLIPGALLTVMGIGMTLSDEWRGIGWRFAAGGPLLVLLGVYFWPRGGPPDTTDG